MAPFSTQNAETGFLQFKGIVQPEKEGVESGINQKALPSYRIANGFGMNLNGTGASSFKNL
jgi:hypothetical protein